MESALPADFASLFRQHHKGLCDLAYNIVCDRDAAKDIVQEVFVKLWNSRSHVIFGDQIKHYLYKATVHTAYNYVRSHKRLFSLDDYKGLDMLRAFPETESIEFRELELRTRQAIDRLPAKCKSIYLLSRQEGLKYQEIADTLGISLKTVENQMGIALEKLRQELKPFLSLEMVTWLAAAGLALYRLIFIEA
jgi:RNA polymerase sigma-70 factor (ECF subfamily)